MKEDEKEALLEERAARLKKIEEERREALQRLRAHEEQELNKFPKGSTEQLVRFEQMQPELKFLRDSANQRADDQAGEIIRQYDATIKLVENTISENEEKEKREQKNKFIAKAKSFFNKDKEIEKEDSTIPPQIENLPKVDVKNTVREEPLQPSTQEQKTTDSGLKKQSEIEAKRQKFIAQAKEITSGIGSKSTDLGIEPEI